MVLRGGGYKYAIFCQFLSMGIISSDEDSLRIGLGLVLVFIFSKYLGKYWVLEIQW